MEKTLAAAGRKIDTAGAVVASAAATATVEVASFGARMGKNFFDRTTENGVLGVIFAPIPCVMYGAVVGAADTFRGR